MTRLLWDEIGTHFFEAGVDRGVLYLSDNTGVAWSGLTAVDQDFDTETSEPLYFEGIKYFNMALMGDYNATLKALTYPPEFIPYEGYSDDGSGIYGDDQGPKLFGLCYRNRLGNDIFGTDFAYQLHLLYNLTAIPDTRVRNTESETALSDEFVWKISGLPANAPGYKATAHVILDSRYLPSYLLEYVEELLYGTDVITPSLPALADLVELMASWTLITITDNGDGTWTANGPDELITDNGDGTFEIDEATAVFLNEFTYDISSG